MAEERQPQGIAWLLRVLLEGAVLLLVAATPWYYAGVEPLGVLGVHLGVAVLLALVALLCLVEGQMPLRVDLAGGVLLGLVGLSLLQQVPLPESAVGVLSPQALANHRALLPEAREAFAGEAATPRPTQLPLSLVPEETRRFTLQLLNLLVIYLAVRGYLAGREPVRRLAWVAAVNGGALALFGLVQFFTSRPDAIYFHEVIDGAGVFSSFVCRNHFPDYAALCVGLGVTLLFSGRRRDTPWRPEELLEEPRTLLLTLLLALMLAGIAFSLSRGGMLSFAVACGLTLTLLGKRSRRAAGPLLALAALSLTLVIGLGSSSVGERLGTLTAEGVARESRFRIWAEGLNLIPQYLAAGTGNGTYPLVETMGRTDPGNARWSMGQMHNEYLGALFEGGLPRLLLTLLLLLPIGYAAWRLPQLRGRSGYRVVAGAVLGLGMLAMHCLVDFGIQMPAVAILAAVVLAQCLNAVASLRPTPRPLGRVAAVLAIPVALGLALVLVRDGWDYAQAQEALRRSRQLANEPRDTLNERLRLLEAAVGHTPRDGELHSLLGQTRYEAAQRFAVNSAERNLYRDAALRAWRDARDLAPVLAIPHARLGANRARFATADPAARYLERARRLAPNDPTIWYLSGNLAADAGAWEDARQFWQRSLQLGPDHVEQVSRRAAGHFNASELIDSILPPVPEALARAADQLHPVRAGSDPARERQPFIRRAAQLLAERNPDETNAILRLAGFYRELEEYAKAIPAYRRAIDRDPTQAGWRVELARTLHEDRQYEPAMEELRKLIREERGSQEVRNLLAVWQREQKLRE